MKKFRMNNGLEVPAIGLGTRQVHGLDSAKLVSAVKDAIDAGYRHIDCAYFYGCEAEVGQAVREKIEEGVVRREDLFITSKLWPAFAETERVPKNCKMSLENFKLDYLDLYLIHTPIAVADKGDNKPTVVDVTLSNVDYLDTWRGMEKCVEMGMAKSIGVSNFNSRQLQRVLDNCKIPPAMNQIECHPYLSQQGLADFCNSKGVVVTGYCPLGAGHRVMGKPQLMNEPILAKLAEKHDKTKAQIILRWLLQREIIPIPKSDSPVHLRENMDVFDFELSSGDMSDMNSLNRNDRIIDMPWAKEHKFYPFHGEM